MSDKQGQGSQNSLAEATRGRAEFSGHGGSLGAAGHYDDADAEHHKDPVLIDASGESVIIDPNPEGYPDISIGLTWDIIQLEKEKSFIGKLLSRKDTKAVDQNVDLDLGCLYELKNGERGCLQAFGDLLGDYHNPPYIKLSGDERTGAKEGVDEFMTINGKMWPEIKRILLYIYIYEGAPDWRSVRPTMFVDIPGDEDLRITPQASQSHLPICAVGTLENLKNGLKLTNHTEYFPGHPGMDRAYGYGLQWEDGEKQE